MDRKIVSLIFVLIAFISLPSCEPSDVDGLPQGKYYFMIINNNCQNVAIECHTTWEDYEDFTINLAAGDSVIYEGYPDGFEYIQFPKGELYIVFDDTLKYSCSYVDEEKPYYSQMLKEILNFDFVLDGPDIYLRSYEITEKEYEYAKAHPYKFEEE